MGFYSSLIHILGGLIGCDAFDQCIRLYNVMNYSELKQPSSLF